MSARIVFMGTPEFAVESLKALIEESYNIVGVVTTPDKAVGKHHSTLRASAVKQYALSQNLPVLQPERLKNPDFIEELRNWKADIQIVVAFRMLPEIVWNMPPLGTFNLHASLLPQYRGAAPINWAIINGEKKTGVTTFFLTHEIDTGKIINQSEIPINELDNAEMIHDRLMHIGARLVVKTVDDIINDRIEAIPQEQIVSKSDSLKPAPKIFKETCEINWNNSTESVYNFIRGLSPYPAAWTELETKNGKLNLKIFEVEKIEQSPLHIPGTVISNGRTTVDICTKDGYIRLKDIQPAGKKRMNIIDFLRGNAHLWEK